MDNREWAVLFNQFYPKRLEFESNKHLFTKIAFDVFQLNSSPVESLWLLETDSDGKQYLAATYDDSDITQKEAVGDWSALSNKEASMVVLYYKDFPLHKFAASTFGFNQSDVQIFQKALVNKTADPIFVRKVVNAQPEDKKDLVLKQFPELV